MKAPIAPCRGLPLITGDGKADFNLRPGDHRSGRVFHDAINRAGISQLRAGWTGRKKQHQPQNHHHAATQMLQHFFSIPFESYDWFLWKEATGKFAAPLAFRSANARKYTSTQGGD